jgi:hypothetical protein
MILTVDLERERKLLVTKLVLQSESGGNDRDVPW